MFTGRRIHYERCGSHTHLGRIRKALLRTILTDDLAKALSGFASAEL